MKRGGIQLSINMLVTIIIGVIIVSMGTWLTMKLTTQATDMAADVPRQMQDRLFKVLLGPNDKIAVIENVRTTVDGKDVTFPVGLQNLLEHDETEFKPMLHSRPVVAPPPGPGTPDCVRINNPVCPSLRLLDTKYTLRRFDKVAFLALVNVPRGAPAGEYTFDVEVDTTRYKEGGNWVGFLGPYAKAKVHVNVE